MDRRALLHLGVVALALGVSGTARGITFSGDFVLIEDLLVVPGPTMVSIDHTNGFGDSDAVYPPVTANAGGPDVGHPSGTLVTAGAGESSAEAAGHYDIAGQTISWSFANGGITLTQTDLDPLTANGVATLSVGVGFRWQSFSPALFDVSFDIVTNATPGDTAEFSMLVCHGRDAATLPAYIAGGGLGQGDCSVGGGGVDGELEYLTADLLDGGMIANAGMMLLDVDGGEAVTLAGFNLRVGNDNGPVTLSLENFELSISEVPAPGASALLALGLGATLVRGRRRPGKPAA